MKNTGLDETTKRKIVGVIKAMIPDAKIYLYGSRARGDYKHGSDIDIALDCGYPLEFVAVGEVRDMLNSSNIPHKFDVVDLNSINETMRQIIQKEGILWKD